MTDAVCDRVIKRTLEGIAPLLPKMMDDFYAARKAEQKSKHLQRARTEDERICYARDRCERAVRENRHLPWEEAWEQSAVDPLLPEEIGLRVLAPQIATVDRKQTARLESHVDRNQRDDHSERAKAYAMQHINRGEACSFEEALAATK